LEKLLPLIQQSLSLFKVTSIPQPLLGNQLLLSLSVKLALPLELPLIQLALLSTPLRSKPLRLLLPLPLSPLRVELDLTPSRQLSVSLLLRLNLLLLFNLILLSPLLSLLELLLAVDILLLLRLNLPLLVNLILLSPLLSLLEPLLALDILLLLDHLRLSPGLLLLRSCLVSGLSLRLLLSLLLLLLLLVLGIRLSAHPDKQRRSQRDCSRKRSEFLSCHLSLPGSINHDPILARPD
jgi:hypothetical protein